MPEPFSTCARLQPPMPSPLSGPPEGPQGGQPLAWPGGQSRAVCTPAHGIASRPGSSSLATQTEPQQGPRGQTASQPGAKAPARRLRRDISGAEPSVPTRPRAAGRCRCPALPGESTARSSSTRGGGCAVQKHLPRSAIAGGLVGAGDQLCTPGWLEEPWLPALLLPPARCSKCSVSIAALGALLLPTFPAADLSRAPSLSATCPGAPSKVAGVRSCLEKERGGRKGTDSVGRARQRRGGSVHPAARGKGKRMFCNIW